MDDVISLWVIIAMCIVVLHKEPVVGLMVLVVAATVPSDRIPRLAVAQIQKVASTTKLDSVLRQTPLPTIYIQLDPALLTDVVELLGYSVELLVPAKVLVAAVDWDGGCVL